MNNKNTIKTQYGFSHIIVLMLFVMVGVIVFSIVRINSQTEQSKQKNSTSTSAKPVQKIVTLKLGETADVGQFTIQPLGFSCFGKGPLVDIPPQGHWCSIGFYITNNNSAALSLSPQLQELTDSQGRTYAPNSEVTLIGSQISTGVPKYWYKKIIPGEQVYNAWVFDIPVDNSPKTIKFDAGDGSSAVLFDLDEDVTSLD